MSLNRQDSAQGDNLGRDGEKLHESSRLPTLASEYATVSQNTHSWSGYFHFRKKSSSMAKSASFACSDVTCRSLSHRLSCKGRKTIFPNLSLQLSLLAVSPAPSREQSFHPWRGWKFYFRSRALVEKNTDCRYGRHWSRCERRKDGEVSCAEMEPIVSESFHTRQCNLEVTIFTER